MSNRDGGPAFPLAGEATDEDLISRQCGMSLRDYFAAHATEEDIRAVMKFWESYGNPCDRVVARFRHADAMLAARGKK